MGRVLIRNRLRRARCGLGSGAARRAAALALLASAGCSDWRDQQPTYRPAVDLVERFPRAVARSETEVIDFGTPAARSHLLRGWSIDQKGLGAATSFVWSSGKESLLEFYLNRARDLPIVLRCMPFEHPAGVSQRISFEVNGRRAGQVELDRGLAEYEHVLPRGVLRQGDNLLALRYAYALAPKALGLSDDPRELAVAWDWLRLGPASGGAAARPAADRKRATLSVPYGTRLDYYLRLPRGSAFGSAGLSAPAAGGLTLLLQVEGAAERELGRWSEARRLGPFALGLRQAALVRLSLQADAAPGTSGAVTLERPLILTRAVASAAAAGAESDLVRPAGAKRPNVLVYLVDALRADHLGCYGYDRPVSPNIDAFAREATIFSDAITECSWTRPSVASLLTGLYPKTHGVQHRGHGLAPQARTAAEYLTAVGYYTAAFVTNGNVKARFGFDQGFDDFVYLPQPHDGTGAQGADRVNQKFFAWLERRPFGPRPFFAYIHTSDPHSPYTPPAEFRRRFAAAVTDPAVGSIDWLNALRQRTLQVSSSTRADLLQLYDGEIAFNDHHFGALLAELRRLELEQDSLVIFLSDHGEEFDEHGLWEHGLSLFQQSLHVPLIVKLPAAWELRQTPRVGGLVQLVDILPTILTAVGAEPPLGLQGRSLLARMAARAPGAARPAFSELNLDGRVGSGVTDSRWKLIRQWEVGGTQGYEASLKLFDRAADRSEQHNVLERHPVARGYLSSLLAAYEAQVPAELQPTEVTMDEETRRQLEALGYVQPYR